MGPKEAGHVIARNGRRENWPSPASLAAATARPKMPVPWPTVPGPGALRLIDASAGVLPRRSVERRHLVSGHNQYHQEQGWRVETRLSSRDRQGAPVPARSIQTIEISLERRGPDDRPEDLLDGSTAGLLRTP